MAILIACNGRNNLYPKTSRCVTREDEVASLDRFMTGGWHREMNDCRKRTLPAQRADWINPCGAERWDPRGIKRDGDY